MKKYVFGILLLGLTAFLTGCLEDEDGYSLSKMWVGFGVLEGTEAGSDSYQIVMDNGDVLIPIASEYHYHDHWYYHHSDSASRLHAGDRILINYTILGDEAGDDGTVEEYYIKVNSVKKILMKGILDINEENQDSIGNDPIIVEKVWLSDSLLNFELKYWGHSKLHFINLVKQPGTANQPVELELRHNANDDEDHIPYVAYVSFKLDALKMEGEDSVNFKVTSTNYDGEEQEFEGEYEY